MIDNFDFKKFLMENKLGSYSKAAILTENSEYLPQMQETYEYGKEKYTGTGETKEFSPRAILSSYYPSGVEIPTTVTPGIVFQEVVEGGMSQTARTNEMIAGDTYVVKEEIDVETINPFSGAKKGTVKMWVCEKLKKVS